MATAFAPTRVVRHPRRLDLRIVLGLVIMVFATGGSLAVWSASADTQDILVTTHDLQAGATIMAQDVAVAHVRVPDAVFAAAVPAAGASQVVGKRLAVAVGTHELLTRSEVATAAALGPDQVAIAIPATSDTAVGGRLRPGDAVEVFVTTGKGTPASQTTVALPRAMVYAVDHAQTTTVVSTAGTSSDQGTTGGMGPISTLTLAVTPQQAAVLAQARWNGELTIALLPPPGASL